MNALDPLLVIAVAAGVLALAMLGWALMERRRAGSAETRNWELRERYADTEARLRLFEDQSAAQNEYLRAQAQQQAGAVAEELLKRTDETFRARDELARQKIEITDIFRVGEQMGVEPHHQRAECRFAALSA